MGPNIAFKFYLGENIVFFINNFFIFSVEAYLDMACSLVLYGGSNNKEYALHILQRTRGNVKVTTNCTFFRL